MDFCLAAKDRPGMLLSRRWWDHPAPDILGIRSGHAEAEIEMGGETGKEESEV